MKKHYITLSNIKIYTSYFYQVRFFHPWTIGFSTALFDPKWFHKNAGNGYVWKDSRSVWNGLRIPPLVPGPQLENLCHGKPCSNSPKKCNFLRGYRGQLEDLDFNSILEGFKRAGKQLSSNHSPEFCLLFHEAPWNECSERWVVQDWFFSNGYLIEEWKK